MGQCKFISKTRIMTYGVEMAYLNVDLLCKITFLTQLIREVILEIMLEIGYAKRGSFFGHFFWHSQYLLLVDKDVITLQKLKLVV